MIYLKQSTAIDIKIGPFLDDTDQRTAETALTITQSEVRIAKNDAAWAQKNEATSLSHEENGWYECKLDATDTNTLGQLIVAIHEPGALPVHRVFQIVPSAVFDSLINGTGAGVRSNLSAVNDVTDGVSQLSRSLQAVVLGTVGTASSTTSIVTSSLSPSPTVTDQLKGRIVVFDNDTTTAALRGQATDITGSSTGGVLTVTALTTAPVSGDTFTIN